jgi:hypothetical protein
VLFQLSVFLLCGCGAIYVWSFVLDSLYEAAASVEKNCIEGKQPPEDGCMKPKHVVEEYK